MNNITINISEAKTHLSKYTKLVKEGNTIILAQRNIPFAQIIPLTRIPAEKAKKIKRLMGSLKGKIAVIGDVNKPLTKEELSNWYDRKI